MKPVKRCPMLLIVVLLLAPHVAAQSIKSVEVSVYASGYAKVTEVLTPPNYSVAVEVPLLSENVTGLSVLDENGKPLLFEKNGSVLTVYILNSTTRITITYFTDSLTSKEGKVWNLTYSFPYPVTIKLPPGAVVVDLSDVPLTITSNSITMPPGNQSVSYILPPPTTSTTSSPSPTQTPTTTTTSSTSSTSPSTTSSIPSPSVTPSTTTTPSEPSTPASSGRRNLLPIIGLLAAMGIPAVAYWARNRKHPGGLPISKDELKEKLEAMGLTDEEINALLYVYDQGGRAKQADVRKALGIPKTTAWRMFKRLEEKGLVRVYKRGKENWVELVF
ncbi:helix-turn-helix transcriptional regulator [Thermococcus prieurii]